MVPPVLPSSLSEVLDIALSLSRHLLEHIHCLIVTLGAKGVLVCGEHQAGSVNLQPGRQNKVDTEECVVQKTNSKKSEESESEGVSVRVMYCVCDRGSSSVPSTTQH